MRSAEVRAKQRKRERERERERGGGVIGERSNDLRIQFKGDSSGSFFYYFLSLGGPQLLARQEKPTPGMPRWHPDKFRASQELVKDRPSSPLRAVPALHRIIEGECDPPAAADFQWGWRSVTCFVQSSISFE